MGMKLFMMIMNCLYTHLEIRRNNAMNAVRQALKDKDEAVLNKYPASFVLDVLMGKQ